MTAPRSADRRPNWRKWRKMRRVQIWEGVALSLNIDPDRVRHDQLGWMHERHLFKESKEFDDRLVIACRTLAGADELTDRMANLPEFAAWCVSDNPEWRIPPKLRALARPPTETSQPHSEDKPLDGRRLSSLARIVAALATKHVDINLQDPGAVKQIQALTEKTGEPLSENTVRSHLKDIRKTLKSSRADRNKRPQ